MPFARNSLYGWGICRVLMPRASLDIFTDGRAGESGLPAADHDQGQFFQPFSSVWAQLINRDFPARTSLAVVSTSLAAIVMLSLASLLIPRFFEETFPEPVEIVARLLEEPPPVPRPRLVMEKPALKPEPIPALPKREVVAAPVENKPLVIPPSKRIVAGVRKNQTKAIELTLSGEVSRNYDLPPDRPELLPEAESRSEVFTVARRAENFSNAAPMKKNYEISQGSGVGGVLPQGRAFISAAAGTIVDLPSTKGIKHDFGRPRSQGDGGAPVSGRSFSPDTPSREVAIGPTGKVARTYEVSGGVVGGNAAIPGNSRTSFSAGPRVSNEPDVDISVAGGGGSRISSGASQTMQTSAAPNGGDVSFISGIDAAPLDPSLLVSLNQLGACIDQSEEDRLRTRLATMLEKEGRCRTGNMIFIFKYPQDGWTMQVSLYNPIEFADKCSALLAAIECINHSKQ